MGTLNWPPDMYRILAAWFTIWSRATMAKLKVMISTTGRRPTMAAPIPTPTNPASQMGVSTTRLGPNSSRRPWLTL